MIDAALIHECSDSALPPAIVEKFIAVAGSPDPLAISVRAGNRVILVPAPKTAAEALDLVRHYVRYAVVRVGHTQYPAGLGITEASEVLADLVDACANIGLGTALFTSVYRIVEMQSKASPETVFEKAVVAWRTGLFEGKKVLNQAPMAVSPHDSHSDEADRAISSGDRSLLKNGGDEMAPVVEIGPNVEDVNKADIRIDLSRIGSGGSGPK